MSELFAPWPGGSAAARAVRAGRVRNAVMDSSDRDLGLESPRDDPSGYEGLRTAIAALAAAIEQHAGGKDKTAWETVAEAIGLLQDAEVRMRCRTR
jgi:hypothetical protein